MIRFDNLHNIYSVCTNRFNTLQTDETLGKTVPNIMRHQHSTAQVCFISTSYGFKITENHKICTPLCFKIEIHTHES